MNISSLRNTCRFVIVFAGALTCAACSTTGFGFGDATPLHQMLGSSQGEAAQSDVQRFYAARDFHLAWTGSDEARERAAHVIAALEHADAQGLRPADYRVAPEPGSAKLSEQDAAAYDLALTSALLRYAHDVRIGRVGPKAAYDDAEMPAPPFDAAAELDAALKKDRLDRFLAALPPQHPQYRGLVAALERYRAIAAKGGWPRLTAKTAKGTALAKRLAMEDSKFAKTAHPSAADIKDALQRFQARHDLPDDGNVNAATLEALNVPAARRVAEITANMERWRWLPAKLEARYVEVDVPDQSVDFVENGKTALHSKAIIGRDGENRTPILRTVAQSIVVNPPWDIPDDIAAKAILPHLRKDPNYLSTRNMVLVDAPKDDPAGTQINWKQVKADNLPYQIQEQPGPHNVLGNVMLDMPNSFDVYLHGTSNAAAFERSDRERSHGCVRVEKIEQLGALALAGSLEDPDNDLAQVIASGKTQRVPLAKPLPVYMTYWTANAESDGTVGFRPDRYQRDTPLIARLKGSASATKVSSADD